MRIIFLLLSVFYFVLLVLKNNQVHIPFVSAYFNDLICIPMILFFMTQVMHFIYGIRFKITLAHIVVTTLAIIVSFEFYLPWYSDRYVGDPVDVLCYLTGGAISFLLLRKNKLVPVF